MGVVNATPDSFSDGGRGLHPDFWPGELLVAGADILDLGGESTRPGAQPVGADEEWRRVEPFIERLRGRVTLSIDTTKAAVAERALEAGVEIVNDISGGTVEPEILRLAGRRGAVVVLGHLRG